MSRLTIPCPVALGTHKMRGSCARRRGKVYGAGAGGNRHWSSLGCAQRFTTSPLRIYLIIGANKRRAWTQITIGSSTFQYGYGTANGTYLLALASGQPLALLIMGYQPWLAVAYTPAYRIVPYALRPAFPPNPAKPSPPAPPSPPTQPPAPPSPDPPSPSTPPPSTPGPSPPSLSPTITSPPFPNLQSGPPLHVLFPLDQCPQRDMAVSPYVLSGPYMTGRRVACFKASCNARVTCVWHHCCTAHQRPANGTAC